MPSNPPYLYRSRHGLWYFRLVVPPAKRPFLGKTEIRRSLRTRSKREAVIRCAEALIEATKLMEGHRNSNPPQKPPVSPVAPPKPTLTDVLQAYRHHQTLEGVSLKTIDDKEFIINLFFRIIGNMPVEAITLDHAKRFRDVALKLPPRLNRIKGDKSLNTIIKEATSTISVTTYNNYIKNLSAFFTYAQREGYLSNNPFSGMKIKVKQKQNSFRSTFTGDDLTKIFEAIQHQNKPFKYWLPYLGLYTGARLNELCQLYTKDIKVVDGIPCIHIQQTMPDQHLKTENAERVIPVHSKLIELGFLEYVDSLADSSRLFPELTRHKKHGYSAQPSKWFARLRQSIGLIGDERKDFYSFRHTVADHLKQKGISENLIGGLLGHTTGGITNNRYGKDFKPTSLVPVVEDIGL
ncbi:MULTISPECIES: site-specific integrase [Halomonadaceae]|uniref:site-specific integrase n=1 Tax=Halomonadaceae TaxID=28256 RepID=UPI0015818E2B|nr:MULTISPECIES: site-specific integrase [Halomonas]MDI4637372.1 site-specific integrase [Halomonas sp. BMC7]NUJ61207.1 tyrosine-type recombinase/integrase [Halomonas taeanensis]